MPSSVEIGGAATSCTCTRDDCTSLREELALLRGDFLELESENEQLSEQLATVQSDASSQEIQVQQTMLEKDHRVNKLYAKVGKLRTQLQKQIERHTEKATTTSLLTSLFKPLDNRIEALNLKNEALKLEITKLKMQLERKAVAETNSHRQVTQVTATSNDERSEFYTAALKENKFLRNKTMELRKAMESMVVQINEYKASNATMQDQLRLYRDAADEWTLEMTQLHIQWDNIENERLKKEIQLIGTDEKESNVDAATSDAKNKFHVERILHQIDQNDVKQKVTQNIMCLDQQVQENQYLSLVEVEGDLICRRITSKMEDLESQLIMSQRLRIQDDNAFLDLNERMLQKGSSSDSLVLNNGDAVVISTNDTTVQRQNVKLGDGEQHAAANMRQLQEQRILVQNTELRRVMIEKKFHEPDYRNANYERKPLEDVIKYQKELRKEMKQQHLNVMRDDLSEQLKAVKILHIASEYFKAECGKLFSCVYSDLAGADAWEGQFAIDETVTKQTNNQMQEVEAECLKDLARINGHEFIQLPVLTMEQGTRGIVFNIKRSAEVAKRLQEFIFKRVESHNEDKFTKMNKSDADDTLAWMLDDICKENARLLIQGKARLLKRIERLHRELKDFHSEHLALAGSHSVSKSDDGKAVLLRLLDAFEFLARNTQKENLLLFIESCRLHDVFGKITVDKDESSVDKLKTCFGNIYMKELLNCIKELRKVSLQDVLYNDKECQVGKEDMKGDTELRQDKELHCEEIAGIEQLYEILAPECLKYQNIISLAASQLKTMISRADQEQGNHEQQEKQQHDKMVSLDDQAVVGELQHHLEQIMAIYQQSILQYYQEVIRQQHSRLKARQLKSEVEVNSQKLISIREQSSYKFQYLEIARKQVKERELTARKTKWVAFRERLDTLEDDLQAEQNRRIQYKTFWENNQAQLPLHNFRQQEKNRSNEGCRKSQVDALSMREVMHMGQLKAACGATKSKDKKYRLQSEIDKTRMPNTMLQVDEMQAHISELLKRNDVLIADNLSLKSEYEILKMELQYARARLLNGERWQHDIQRAVDQSSPLVRQKLGFCVKDQVKLQRTAKVTIASLNQPNNEKNTLNNDYLQKFAVVRASRAQEGARNRLKTTRLYQKLNEENQRMIEQLKDAMNILNAMKETCVSEVVLQTANERYDHILQEWKLAHIALEGARQSIRKLQMKLSILRNDKDFVEAHAVEAQGEILLLKEKLIESVQHCLKLEHQFAFVKCDVAKKRKK